MTKDKALRLALEALEVANSLVDGYYLPKEKAWMPEIEEAITAIKAALLSRSDGEAKDEPVGDNKVKQLVNQCTHRDIDGNWYVDGVQLVHATCDAIIKGTI